jgi:glycosyltransferase involved in cell wall biosynthesis
MKKKTVLIHSNFCRAFTGFGKNKKNLLRYLYNTGKYELVELANGIEWQSPQTKTVPWTCRGSLPPTKQLESLNAEQQRLEGYGNTLVDRAISEFKPDVYIGIEDIWAFGSYPNKPWWNKINTMIWTTLDSLPILPQAVDFAPKIKNYYVWSPFAEKALNEMGYSQAKTLRGSLDTANFHRLNDENRKKLRKSHGIGDEFIIGFVFRNQLRKSVPNLLDGFKLFKDKNPKSKLLLHTHWSEGWDILRMLEEKNINQSDVLTTYVCSKCGSYSVRNFTGQEQNCSHCGSQKTVNTTNTGRGVTEEQLNEVYNLMDVYCHPFTSGGQEIPIQEAKLTELITLVTNYSCGEDSCSEASAGIPLNWSEYREPGTQFIKASTCPNSIFEELQNVYSMTKEEREKLGKKARDWVIENFSIKAIGSKLEKIIDEMPEVDYDFDFKKSSFNAGYKPKENYSTKEEFLKDIYKNILNDDVDENSSGLKHWLAELNKGTPPANVVNHFKQIAAQQTRSLNASSLSDLLDKNDKGKRIAVVIPQSGTDLLMINALLQNLKKLYKGHNIYIFTKPEYFQYIDDNPNVHKLLHYSPAIENAFTLEGIGPEEGLFEIAFYPHNTTQKNPCYTHNGKDKLQFSLN